MPNLPRLRIESYYRSSWKRTVSVAIIDQPTVAELSELLALIGEPTMTNPCYVWVDINIEDLKDCTLPVIFPTIAADD